MTISEVQDRRHHGDTQEPLDEVEKFVSDMQRLNDNSVKGDQKVTALVTLVGSKTYTLAKDLVTREKPAELSYAELTKKIQDHLDPGPIIIEEIYRFVRCNQEMSETIPQYIYCKAKAKSVQCKFGANLNQRPCEQ